MNRYDVYVIYAVCSIYVIVSLLWLFSVVIVLLYIINVITKELCAKVPVKRSIKIQKRANFNI